MDIARARSPGSGQRDGLQARANARTLRILDQTAACSPVAAWPSRESKTEQEWSASSSILEHSPRPSAHIHLQWLFRPARGRQMRLMVAGRQATGVRQASTPTAKRSTQLPDGTDARPDWNRRLAVALPPRASWVRRTPGFHRAWSPDGPGLYACGGSVCVVDVNGSAVGRSPPRLSDRPMATTGRRTLARRQSSVWAATDPNRPLRVAFFTMAPRQPFYSDTTSWPLSNNFLRFLDRSFTPAQYARGAFSTASRDSRCPQLCAGVFGEDPGSPQPCCRLRAPCSWTGQPSPVREFQLDLGSPVTVSSGDRAFIASGPSRTALRMELPPDWVQRSELHDVGFSATTWTDHPGIVRSHLTAQRKRLARSRPSYGPCRI